jgi:hypothetical protein
MPIPPLPPRFARIAVLRGHLQTSQVLRLLEEPLDALHDDGSLDLAMRCLKRGLLTPPQVRLILLEQQYEELREEDKALGARAMKAGLVDAGLLRLALEAQATEFATERRLPRRLGQILVEAEAVTAEEIDALREGASERITTRIPLPAGGPPAPGPAPSEPRRFVPPAVLFGWLVVERGECVGRRFPLGARNRVGRDPDVQVCVPDPDVSRHHAMLEFEPTTYRPILTDLGSRNGTRLCGTPVQGPVLLKHGDRVEVGNSILRLELTSMPAVRARPLGNAAGRAVSGGMPGTKGGGEEPGGGNAGREGRPFGAESGDA